MEHGRKEIHLLSGLVVQILMVGLLVFAYTQAIRQVNYQRDLHQRLQEQLTMAREQVSRQGPTPDVSIVQAKIQALRAGFLSPGTLAAQADQIRLLTEKEFKLKGVRWEKPGEKTSSFSISIPGRDDFKVDLYELEMEGETATSEAGALLATLEPASGQPVLPLVNLEMTGTPQADRPVHVLFRWLMPVVVGTSTPGSRAVVKPAWGWREEPFLSPLDHPAALRIPPEKTASLRLTGILWDPVHPACVINGQSLRAGELVSGNRVVLITADAVLLQGPDGELLLRL